MYFKNSVLVRILLITILLLSLSGRSVAKNDEADQLQKQFSDPNLFSRQTLPNPTLFQQYINCAKDPKIKAFWGYYYAHSNPYPEREKLLGQFITDNPDATFPSEKVFPYMVYWDRDFIVGDQKIICTVYFEMAWTYYQNAIDPSPDRETAKENAIKAESYMEKVLQLPDNYFLPIEKDKWKNLATHFLFEIYKSNNEKEKFIALAQSVLNNPPISDEYVAPTQHVEEDGHLIPEALLIKIESGHLSENEQNQTLNEIITKYGMETWAINYRMGNYGDLAFYMSDKNFCESALNNPSLNQKYVPMIYIRLGDLALMAKDPDTAKKYYEKALALAPYDSDVFQSAINDDFDDFDSNGGVPSFGLTNVTTEFYLPE